uniref:response regulator n=1 Tax=Pseudoalteromonas mariniglutinosa TaxID=206042 RepID=UPI00387F4A84
MPLWFLGSSEFLLGQFFVILSMLLFGWRLALMSFLLSSGFMFYRWEHAWPAIVFALELIYLHVFCLQRARPVFVRGMVFWFAIGLPLLWLFGYFILQLPLLTIVIALAKYCINAAIYLTVIDLLSFFFNRHSWQRHHPSLYKILNYIVTLLVVLVVILTSTILTNHHYSRIEYEINTQLNEKSADIANKIDSHLEHHKRGVLFTAASLSQGFTAQLALANLITLYPDFRTAIVADEAANVVHFYPDSFKQSLLAERVNLNVADRDYFNGARDTQAGFVSNIFESRGYGDVPAVAISAPIIAEQQFLGVVEASLLIESFIDLRPVLFSHLGDLLILDASNKVVFSTLDDFQVMQQLPEQAISSIAQYGKYRTFTATDEQQYFMMDTVSERHGWRAITLMNRKNGNIVAVKAWGQSIVLIVFIIILTSVLITQLSRWLIAPILKLTEQIDNFAANKNNNEFKPSHNTWLEVQRLQQQYAHLATHLTVSFEQLRQASSKNEKLNNKLQNFNVRLEQEVNEKTEELLKAVAVANRANKTKSQFLANMSHEIRTPLNGILGMTQLLQSNDKLPQSERDGLALIHQSASNLLLILNDILDFSKIEAEELKLDVQVVEIKTLLHQLATVFKHSGLQQGVTFSANISAQLPEFINIDPLRLGQVINNLLSNAGKFTEQGEIVMHADLQASELVIRVCDTGIGISADQQTKLFTAFTQADISTTRKYGGTGLGLTISKRIIELMHGQLTVESALGEGSCFTAKVPLIESADASQQCVEQTPPDLSGIQVLIVEDNPINQIVLESMLSVSNCTIAKATDGVKALACLENFAAQLILMDCQMPNMDGYQCTKTIRKQADKYGPVTIIAITANAFADDKMRCLEAGMNYFISKPINKNELYQVIHHWLKTLADD